MVSYSIPETRKDMRKDLQVLVPTSELIAISLHQIVIIKNTYDGGLPINSLNLNNKLVKYGEKKIDGYR